MGLVVEPSGAAAVAAVLTNKVPDTAGKKVVAFITGGNVSPLELDQILNPKSVSKEQVSTEGNLARGGRVIQYVDIPDIPLTLF